MKITVDKIASVLKNVPLTRTLKLKKEINSVEGEVIVVEVISSKREYNKLELKSGHLSVLRKGDIIAVALGNRRALKGFVGEIPNKLELGDIINILNIGGVTGKCISENIQEVGHALKVKVLGAVINESNKTLNIKDFRLFNGSSIIKNKPKLIIVTGTCMQVGKTSVVCSLLNYALHKEIKASSAKIAGIAALRDINRMIDAGANKTVSFLDAGYTSTVKKEANLISITKGAINYLNKDNPEYIIIEFGDGILGEYGVMTVLKDKEIRRHIAAHVGCAYDPVGAIKLAEIYNKMQIPLDLISGPVTDNSVGTQFIKKNIHIPAINALTAGKKLSEIIFKISSGK